MINYKMPVFLFCNMGTFNTQDIRRGVVSFSFLAGNIQQARIAADYTLYAVMNAYSVSE